MCVGNSMQVAPPIPADTAKDRLSENTTVSLAFRKQVQNGPIHSKNSSAITLFGSTAVIALTHAQLRPAPNHAVREAKHASCLGARVTLRGTRLRALRSALHPEQRARALRAGRAERAPVGAPSSPVAPLGPTHCPQASSTPKFTQAHPGLTTSPSQPLPSASKTAVPSCSAWACGVGVPRSAMGQPGGYLPPHTLSFFCLDTSPVFSDPQPRLPRPPNHPYIWRKERDSEGGGEKKGEKVGE